MSFIKRLLAGKSSRLELIATALAVTMAIGGGAYAAGKISGKKLKNGSVSEKKLNKAVRAKLNKLGGSSSGAPGAPGATGASAQFNHSKWAVISRNTIGSGIAQLVDGPFGRTAVTDTAATVPPPKGTGSLLLQTSDSATSAGSPAEKIAFGNEVDFAGLKIADLANIGFSVFTDAENGTTNLPSIVLEINPDVTGATDGYSSMVYIPPAVTFTAAGQWFAFDAATQGQWYLTGSEGTTIGCNQVTTCSLSQLKTNLGAFNNGANTTQGAQVSLSVGVSKGRDNTFTGNVDALRINNDVYDFEADGVKQTTP
jgi:hypothetical protein